MSNKAILFLAITWIVLSVFWFLAENVGMGIVWQNVGVLELIIALVKSNKDKNSR